MYNESYELVTNADVAINIINSADKTFSYIFSPDNVATKTFNLDAGLFPIGDYTYQATAKIGDLEYKKNGKFTVVSINQEAENTIANHQLMYQLAENHNGSLYYPSQFETMLNELKQNSNIVPISYSEKRLQDVINLKIIFFLLLILLSAEWFMRKYFGSY